MSQEHSNPARSSSAELAQFTQDEYAALRRIKAAVEHGDYFNDFGPGLDPRRLAFARYLVQTGRLSDDLHSAPARSPSKAQGKVKARGNNAQAA